MTMLVRHWNEPKVEARVAQPSALRKQWSRASRWIVATAKKVFPAIAVLAVFAAVLAATIALRVAIWVPLHFHP